MFQNIQFTHQSNFITDMILAAVLFLLSFFLSRMTSKTAYQQMWQYYFVMMGLAALIGGIGHLLSLHAGKSILLISWFIVIWATYYLETSTFFGIYEASFIRKLLLIKSILLTIWLFYTQTFFPVTLALIIGMAGIVCTVLYLQYVKTTESANIIIITAILSGSLSALVRVFHINLATWFNANDLAHIMSACSYYGLYVGIKKYH